MTSLAQVVAALSVTYDDAGVAIWLGSRNRGLGGAAPIDVIARDPLGGLERVAHLVRAIGDADPTSGNGKERPEEDINDASMCVCGVPDLGHDDVYPTRPHCADCHRPLPHNTAEARACSKTEAPRA